MGIAIKFENVSFKYDGANNYVLENVNFEIHYGELVLLSGVSGEGKSTLLSIINGVIPFVNSGKLSGNVEIDGKNITKEKISSRSKLVGTVLQNADEQIVYDFANDEIAFGCENLNTEPSEIENRITKYTSLLKIDKTARTRTMSGGQKQRLITASTLAMEQKIIILDEPLANLDTEGAHILLGVLKELVNVGYAVLIVEHRLDIVKDYADRVMWIKNKCVFSSYDKRKLDLNIKIIEANHKGTAGKTLIKAENIDRKSVV